MAGKTHYFQHLILNWLRGTPMPAPPSGLYLGLLTASPTDGSLTTNEVAGNGYARQALALGANADMTSWSQDGSASGITFPAAIGAGWGTVIYAAIFDALTGGNMFYYTALPSPLAVPAASVVSFVAGAVIVSEA